MRRYPSHISTTPHPDGPQRLSELKDVDVFWVDWNDINKLYAFKYTNKPDEYWRFWELVEVGAGSWFKLQSQNWVVNPEWVVYTRYIDDEYVDTFSGIKYRNPNPSGNTWRQSYSSWPA